MKMLGIYTEGKTKIVYNTEEDDKAIIKYKDDITAFNGEKRDVIKSKGRINSQISTKLFNYLETKGSIKTHFICLLDDERVLVEKSEMIPIEVVVRNKAAGGLLKKDVYAKEGDVLPFPILEFHLKDDSRKDPEVSRERLVEMGLVSEVEANNIEMISHKVNSLLKSYFEDIRLDLVDFKIEFGRKGGELLLADEITPDSCRLWDMETREKYDKDVFREELGDVIAGYEEVLKRMNSKN